MKRIKTKRKYQRVQRIKMKQSYFCQYKDNATDEFKEYQFEAENDSEAQLIAISFCDNGWHKLYGVSRVS